jgi:hypothetical protein
MAKALERNMLNNIEIDGCGAESRNQFLLFVISRSRVRILQPHQCQRIIRLHRNPKTKPVAIRSRLEAACILSCSVRMSARIQSSQESPRIAHGNVSRSNRGAK